MGLEQPFATRSVGVSRFIAAGLLAAGVVLGTPAAGAPTLVYDQVIGSSYPHAPGRLGNLLYLSVSGPDYGVASYDLTTGVGTTIDAPRMTFSAFPLVVGNQVFFRGVPADGDGSLGLYRVAGAGSTLLATTDDLGAAGTMRQVGSQAVFAFADPTHGNELWITDATVVGTHLLVDINPGGDSDPVFGPVINGVLFFSADDGVHGRELWKCDGTAAGTVMVKDIEPGPDGSAPSSFVATGSWVVFRASDSAAGTEPWKSDGTAANTVMIEDIEPGITGSSPIGFAKIGSWIYFQARRVLTGAEPYRTDGNVVEFIADINPSFGASSPEGFAEYDGLVYFQADDGVHGRELWRTNGTAAGTELFAEFEPGSAGRYVREFTVHAGALYFVVTGDEAFDDDLWRTEGTAADLTRIAVRPDFGSRAMGLYSDGTYLYFGANDGTQVGHELRRLTWGEESLELAYDYNTDNGGNAEQLTAYDGNIVGIAHPYATGRDLWLYDLADIESSRNLDELLDLFEDQMPVGAELVVDGSLVYFTSFDGDTGFEVAVYDGVEVHQLDVNPGPTGCTPSDLVVTDNGKAFFVGRDEASGNFGLYRITPPPSVAVGLVHDCGNDRPEQLTVLGGSVIFVNTDPDHGTELWTSNGTTTQLLADINPGTAGSNPQSLVRMGEHVFFTATRPDTGRELWTTNGTGFGTHLVGEVNVGPASSAVNQLTDAYPLLYFRASTPSTASW
ncbi:MAG: hypothetical protein KC729_16310, partial [Candidatus Eisenbacteria bacterium]|nr:hypothetical protein [Candidatus Eisenbacteria bacterium]